MLGLLSNAWNGWQSYVQEGKYAALLLLVLLLFWFYKRGLQERQLFVYATLMTLACICPLTAAVLMKWQTGFYDYRWIWSYVPLTICLAFGAVVFLWEQWECYEKEEKTAPRQKSFKKLGVSLLLLALVNVCGSLGNIEYEGGKQSREHTRRVLEQVTEQMGTEEICLWAPEEIMADARAVDSRITLVYGRNIWDQELGAYFYEPYGADEELLYGWMSNVKWFGEVKFVTMDGRSWDGYACMDAVKKLGVNAILLPGHMQETAVKAFEEGLGADAVAIEGYFLFTL